MSRTLLSISLLLGLGLTSVGCTYDHDPETYFAANWETSYLEIAGCEATSAHQASGYVRVLLSPDAKAVFCNSPNSELPVGSVIVKEQWADDPSCTPGGWNLFTVMRKAEDLTWHWQTVGGAGNIVGTSGPNPGCTGGACHGGTPPRFVFRDTHAAATTLCYGSAP